MCAEVTVSPKPVLHPGPYLPSEHPSYLHDQAPNSKDWKTPKFASLLLKYIFWAVPTYPTQHGLFGTESWRIKNQ